MTRAGSVALLAATGFAPEEWLAHTVDGLRIPESVLHLWAADVDVRVVPIAIGTFVLVIGLPVAETSLTATPRDSPETSRPVAL